MAEGLNIDLRSDLQGEGSKSVGVTKRLGEWWLDVFRSWAPALLIVLVIRSILVEPFQIPSGSMVPTLAIGDFILVSKFAYGLRVPFTSTEVLPLGEPERGDVVVFRHPPSESADEWCWAKQIPEVPSRVANFLRGRSALSAPPCSIDYIKRIVGLPGDTLEVRDSVLYINGTEQSRRRDGNFAYTDQDCREEDLQIYTEALTGAPHPVLQSSSFLGRIHDYGPVTVPPDEYFMMGDNRDHSSDSRFWGFVPRDYIRGKALFVWLSLDPCGGSGNGFGTPRGERFGQKIE